jgi:hypothetical protein
LCDGFLQDGDVGGDREETVDSDFSLGIRSRAFAAGPPKMERSQVYRQSNSTWQSLTMYSESSLDQPELGSIKMDSLERWPIL